jgi:alpha-mannosidase
VTFQRQLTEKSQTTVSYRLDAFQPVLHIEYDIDWRDEHTLLKAVFPTAFDGRMARFGAPFGSVLRSQQAGPMRDEAMFEGAASRWAIVSDDAESAGLAVITEAKFGFSCREGSLGVSLIRSPRVTGEDADHRRLFLPELRRGGSRKGHSDIGRHKIRLALAFHGPDQTRPNLAPALADTLFTAPIPSRTAAVNAGLIAIEGGDSLIPCWAKPAEDGNGWILRLHETLGRRGEAQLVLRKGLAAHRLTLSENGTGKRIGNAVPFSPYELLSIRIAPRSRKG